MPRYNFTLSGEVEADGLRDAEDKIMAGVGYENIDLEEGPDEIEEVIEDDEEK